MTWLCVWFDAPNCCTAELEGFVDYVDNLLPSLSSIELEHADMINGRLRFLCSDKKERNAFVRNLSNYPKLGISPMLVEHHLPRPEGPAHGFYSAKADKLGGGHKIWRGEDGSEVKLTGIAVDPEGAAYKFPDKTYVGRVIGYLRSVEEEDDEPR